jgi:hypothetical protein
MVCRHLKTLAPDRFGSSTSRSGRYLWIHVHADLSRIKLHAEKTRGTSSLREGLITYHAAPEGTQRD